jgi:hypothetical protein
MESALKFGIYAAFSAPCYLFCCWVYIRLEMLVIYLFVEYIDDATYVF